MFCSYKNTFQTLPEDSRRILQNSKSSILIQATHSLHHGRTGPLNMKDLRKPTRHLGIFLHCIYFDIISSFPHHNGMLSPTSLTTSAWKVIEIFLILAKNTCWPHKLNILEKVKHYNEPSKQLKSVSMLTKKMKRRKGHHRL